MRFGLTKVGHRSSAPSSMSAPNQTRVAPSRKFLPTTATRVQPAGGPWSGAMGRTSGCPTKVNVPGAAIEAAPVCTITVASPGSCAAVMPWMRVSLTSSPPFGSSGAPPTSTWVPAIKFRP